MADYNCAACNELREDAPNLLLNGLGTTECTSLKNNTGLNPSAGNDDCTDLENLNDCLIGNLEAEIDAYDVCDWKEFTKNFVDNTWTVFKGIICAICGLWTNITNMQEKLSMLCDLVQFNASPSMPVYGVMPRKSDQSRALGSIPNKNGRPALIDAELPGYDNDTMAGVRYASINTIDCSGNRKYRQEFWRPYIYGYKLNKDLVVGDPVWVVTKSALQAKTEWSDELWDNYTRDSWTWSEGNIIDNGNARHKRLFFRLHVGDAGYDNNHLVLTYLGTSYPDETPNYDALISDGGYSDYRTRRSSR